MALVVDLPRTVVVALAHTLKHLAVFKLTDSFTDASVFTKFTDRTHMLLNGNTLTNL
jgi:DNA mismatch repair protein MSH3